MGMSQHQGMPNTMSQYELQFGITWSALVQLFKSLLCAIKSVITCYDRERTDSIFLLNSNREMPSRKLPRTPSWSRTSSMRRKCNSSKHFAEAAPCSRGPSPKWPTPKYFPVRRTVDSRKTEQHKAVEKFALTTIKACEL